MLGKIAGWERIITEKLFTFEQAEHDSDNVHLVHYAGITLLSDVALSNVPLLDCTDADATAADAAAQKESAITSLLMRRREDGAQLFISHVTIAFESHEEPLVTLIGAYQHEVALSTWHTVLSVWQQFAQRGEPNPNRHTGKMRIAFGCFRYSFAYVLKDRVHQVYLGPVKLLTDVRGFGVYLASDLLRAGSTYNHAVRNKHSGEVFFYEQSEWAPEHMPAAIGFVLDNHIAPPPPQPPLSDEGVSRQQRLRKWREDRGEDGGRVEWTGVVVRGCVHLRRAIQRNAQLRKRIGYALQAHHGALLLHWLDGTRTCIPPGALEHAPQRLLASFAHISHYYVLVLGDGNVDGAEKRFNRGTFGELARLLLLRSAHCRRITYVELSERFFEGEGEEEEEEDFLGDLKEACKCELCAEPSHRDALSLQHALALAPSTLPMESSDSDA